MEIDSGENEWTKAIKSQVKNLTELVNKLVFLSRMDEENAKIVMTDFSLSEVTEEILQSYDTLALAQNKIFVKNISGNVTCHGDANMIKSLLKLLLDNAFKYSDEQGNIKLSVEHNGKSAKITLSNTTNGVPRGNLDMLFERFYRLDASRNRSTGGHGVGLSVAKAITELHKGSITAFSEDGKTITFTVTI